MPQHPATPKKLVIVPEHQRGGNKVKQHIRRVSPSPDQPIVQSAVSGFSGGYAGGLPGGQP